jgi:cytochrome c2
VKLSNILGGVSSALVRLLDRARAAPLITLAGAILGSGMLIGAGLIAGAVLPIGVLWSKVTGKIESLLPEPAAFEVKSVDWVRVDSALHDLEMLKVAVMPEGGGGGGGIDLIDDFIVFASPAGFIGYMAPSGAVRYTDLRAPMRYDAMVASDVFNMPTFSRHWFRTLDLLAAPRGEDVFDLYVTHHRYDDDCVSFVLSRTTIVRRGDDIVGAGEEWETVFEAEPCVPFYREGVEVFSGQVAGGRMQRLSDAELLVSTGDHAFDGVSTPGPIYTDEPDSQLGKVLIVNLATGGFEVFATGTRNPQGLLISEDGTVWETEHGPHGGDELNVLRAGVDYGWPHATLGENYDNKPWPLDTSQSRHDGYQKPAYAFVPSVGTSNLAEMMGPEFPLWDGDLLVASLTARTVFRLRRDGASILYAEPIRVNVRVRDIAVMSDGRFVLLSDDGELLIFRNAAIERDREPVLFTGLGVVAEITAATHEGWQSADTPLGRGRVVFARSCQSCHSMTETNGIGPHLQGLLGRKVGSLDDYPYSAGLAAAKDQRWSEALLREFLDDPQAAFPGTSMADPGISREQVSDLAAFLREGR